MARSGWARLCEDVGVVGGRKVTPSRNRGTVLFGGSHRFSQVWIWAAPFWSSAGAQWAANHDMVRVFITNTKYSVRARFRPVLILENQRFRKKCRNAGDAGVLNSDATGDWREW